MRIIDLTHKDYSIYDNFYKLKLLLNIEYIIPKDDSVRLLLYLSIM